MGYAKVLWTLLLAFSFTVVMAQDNCEYEFLSKQSKVSWTAFKTPKKVGVGAQFDRFSITALSGPSVVDVLKSGVFTIDASSVNSGNKGRDAKIAKFFFSTMKGGALISGSVGQVKKNDGNRGSIEVWFNINDVQKKLPMDFTLDGETIVLTGSMNVLDFALNDELSALNKACKTLHEGKTWSDVDLTLEAKFKKTCQ